MDFKDLSQIDLKSIDISGLQKKILQRQDILIYVVIIIVTVFVAGKILGSQKMKITSIKEKIASLEEKNKTILTYEKEKKSFNDFVANLPKGSFDLNSVINLISEIAIDRNIQIASVTPKGRNSTDYYDAIFLQLNISAADYSDLIGFVQDIETSKYNLRIDNWSITMKTRSSRHSARRIEPISTSEEKVILMEVTMQIASINFK